MSDELNDQLKAWAKGKQADERHRERLNTEVMQRVHDAQDEPASASPVEFSYWKKWSYAAAGMAAAFLIAWSVQRLNPPSPADEVLVVSVEQLKAKAQAFKEIEAMFPNQLRWIASVNGEVHMGLEEEAMESLNEDAASLLVHMRLSVREGKGWQPVWESEIMAQENAWVEVHPEAGGTATLAFWAHKVDDGLWDVSNQFSLKAPVSVQHTSQRLISDAAENAAVEFESGGKTYRLQQQLREMGHG